jgi:hypothetical protein
MKITVASTAFKLDFLHDARASAHAAADGGGANPSDSRAIATYTRIVDTEV